jgi:hypothetical protein
MLSHKFYLTVAILAIGGGADVVNPSFSAVALRSRMLANSLDQQPLQRMKKTLTAFCMILAAP